MIVNLTQHPATLEQREAGVIDLEGSDLTQLKSALTFDDLPTQDEIIGRAETIATLACAAIGNDDIYEQMAREAMGDEDIGFTPAQAVIGGAPWLMPAMIQSLLARGIDPLFAFTKREAVEERQPDGSVRKTAVFRHAGFVPVAK
jgi:hypothetical protein